jgi:hypothetical protein
LRSFALLDLSPLADCAQYENGNDAHAASGRHRSDQRAETKRRRAFAVALQLDECVADQPSREAADNDSDECRNACAWRRKRREGSFVGQFGELVTVPFTGGHSFNLEAA